MILSKNDSRKSKRRRQFRAMGHRARNNRRFLTETLENRTLLAGDLMHNVDLPTDVNADGYTSPLDALYVINELNVAGTRAQANGVAAHMGGMFYDVNDDSDLSPVDALLILNELNAEGESDDLVQMRLEIVDLDGNPIDSIDVGLDFQLRAYVQDLTGRDQGGVFAGFLDVEFDATIGVVDGAIVHGSDYGIAVSGDTSTPGLIDEAGSIDGILPLGPNELLLFTVPMNAQANGLLTFIPGPADLSPAHDVLVYGVPDGEDDGIVDPDQISFIAASIQVGDVQQAPVAMDDDYDGMQDEVLIVDAAEGVLANDINSIEGTLTAVLDSDPLNGSVNLAENGSFSYTPNAEFAGQDTFTYVAVVDEISSNIATVTIDVVAGNTAPVAVDDDYVTDEDTPLIIPAPGVLENDTDADGDSLTAVLISEPSNGTLSLADDGSFVYTPNENFGGNDVFEYVANDSEADSNTATVTITVNPVNDPPVAVDDDYDTPMNQTLNVSAENGVLSNDFDADGHPLTAQLVTTVSNGTLDLSLDGSFVYIPATDFAGIDTFTYSADDGVELSDPATVTIEVTGGAQVQFRLETVSVLGEPIDTIGPGVDFELNVYVQDVSQLPRDGVFAAYLDVMYDASLVLVTSDVIFTEPYSNQTSGNTSIPGLIDEAGAFDGFDPLGDAEFLLFTVPMMAQQSEGTAVFFGDPADDLPGNDILLYNSNTPVPKDQIDYDSTSLEIVAGDPPVAVDDEYGTDEDVPLVVSAEDGVLANDSDPNESALVAVLFSDPSNGTVELGENGSFAYTPDENFNGTDVFTYQAFDGSQLSNVANVTIIVNPIDDDPIAVDDFYQMEDMGVLVVDAEMGVLANDIEVDGEPLAAVLVAGAENGVVALSSDGSFVYTPDVEFVGRDTFTYKAIANEAESNIATVTIDVGDLAPSTILGFVYSDSDNDGILEAGEARYGGVRITLRGKDLFQRDVSLETTTSGDGSYQFDGVLAGNYVLTEFQPLGLVDGKDTINGELSLRNDRFLIDLPGGSVVGDYNFGERGLAPDFIRDPFFFASRVDHGMLAMMNRDGGMEWYCLDTGWVGFASVDVELSANRSTADVSVQDVFGGTDTESIVLNVDRDARLLAPSLGGQLLRLVGDPQDFGLMPVGAVAGLSGKAVDAAFSGDDA